MRSHNRFHYGFLHGVFVMLFIVLFSACTFNLSLPDFSFTVPEWCEDAGAWRFTVSNEGMRTITSFVVRGRWWKDDALLEIRTACTTLLEPGDSGLFQLPCTVADAETDMFFIETLTYGDGHVWRDPMGVFAK